MRIASYRHNGAESYGFVTDGGIVDRSQLGLTAANVRELIASGQVPTNAAIAAASPSIQVADVELLLPVVPDKVLCAGLNFPTHREETGNTAERPEHPIIFSRFADSHVPHGAKLRRPSESTRFDYECELGVVMAKTAWRVSVEEAMDYVFGYVAYNDGSVRDWQRHSAQWIPGKNFYESGSFGPYLVTKDEVPNLDDSLMVTRVNGEVRQSVYIREMVFNTAELISYCSTFTPLRPGDMIATGTTGGVAVAMKPEPKFLNLGDIVEVEIDGVGLLSNEVGEYDVTFS